MVNPLTSKFIIFADLAWVLLCQLFGIFYYPKELIETSVRISIIMFECVLLYPQWPKWTWNCSI